MSSLAEFIKQSWLFPVIQSVHIIGLTILVGTISLVDLRLLGFGLRRHSVADLAIGVAPWTSGGLLTVLLTGPLMFWSDRMRYVNNPAFLVKMALLGMALAAHFTLHRSAVRGRNPAHRIHLRHRVAALLSLILWCSVVIAGRAIADFDIRIA